MIEIEPKLYSKERLRLNLVSKLTDDYLIKLNTAVDFTENASQNEDFNEYFNPEEFSLEQVDPDFLINAVMISIHEYGLPIRDIHYRVIYKIIATRYCDILHDVSNLRFQVRKYMVENKLASELKLLKIDHIEKELEAVYIDLIRSKECYCTTEITPSKPELFKKFVDKFILKMKEK